VIVFDREIMTICKSFYRRDMVSPSPPVSSALEGGAAGQLIRHLVEWAIAVQKKTKGRPK
jgi:hypothetical protein